jgi:hypothetical protein
MGEAPEAAVRDDLLRSSLAPAELFSLVWNGLVEVLGTAATATLIRRAAMRVAATTPDLPSVVVNRNTVTYDYEIPAIWRRPDDARALHSLRTLLGELGLLLRELTGGVVIRRLERLAPLRDAGLSFGEETHAR